jgi:L-amino acid N-acyltransferase YncA
VKSPRPNPPRAEGGSAPVIRPATRSDADAVTDIYNHYILNTVVTFEEQPVSSGEIADRIESIGSARLPWLVAEQGGKVAGYACASKWGGRCSYRFSVESTVYLDPSAVGRGIGTGLYSALLEILRDKSMHVVIGGIALPNAASIALHERLGFRKVAHFSEVGFKFGRWIDVGYWQLELSQ